MTVYTNLRDPRTNNAAHISRDGALKVAIDNQLAVGPDITTAPFSRLLSVDGLGVSTQLTVDGSATPVEGYIKAVEDGDVYLSSMSVVIADSSLDLNQFGSLTALTNGVKIFYDILRGRTTIPVDFKTVFDLIRLSTATPSIGGKIDAFKLSKVDSAGNDGYLVPIGLKDFSPLDFGIRLRKGSNDKFGFQINDNLTGISFFNVLVTGFIQFTSFDVSNE